MRLATPPDLINLESEVWSLLIDLLNDRQYENAKSILSKIKRQAQDRGDAAQVSMLTAAYQICATCQDHQEDTLFFKQAYETAVDRENVFLQQLTSLLTSIGDTQSADSNQPDDTQTKSAKSQNDSENEPVQVMLKAAGLWQKLQNFLIAEPPRVQNNKPPPIETAPAVISSPAEEESKTKMASIADEIQSQDQHNSAKDTPTLSIYCLGAFRVYIENVLIDEWSGQIGKTIFKYLLSHREVPVHRDVLIDIFWPDDSVDSVRRNLYQAIYAIRQALRKSGYDFQYIQLEESSYLINPGLEIWVDSEEFMDNYQKGYMLENQGDQRAAVTYYEMAENLYGGAYLSEDIFEDWSLPQRENIRMIYLEILSRLSQYYWDVESYTNCIIKSRKILEADDCREDAHRRLMLAYSKLGQRHLAIRQYYQCELTLKTELNIAPMPATRELYQMIQKAGHQ